MPNENEIKKMKKIVEALLDGNSAAEVFIHKNPDNIPFAKIKEIEIMIRNEDPFIKLDSKETKNKAPVLSYNLQQSTTLRGQGYMMLNHLKVTNRDSDWWNTSNIGP
jgi:hypothetical protein